MTRGEGAIQGLGRGSMQLCLAGKGNKRPSGTCGGPGGGCIHQELQARQCPWTMFGTVLGVHGRFSGDTQAAPGVPVPGAPPFPKTTRHGFHSVPTTAAPHCPTQAKLGFTPVSSTQHRDPFLLTAIIAATALSDHGPRGPWSRRRYIPPLLSPELSLS